MLIHQYSPMSQRMTTLLFFVKNLRTDICDSDNFRGIALTSCINKLFDWILLLKFQERIKSCNLQFAYKQYHSTTLCTLALKEVVKYYNSSGSDIYACLIDASKAFDRVRYDKLFSLLRDRGLPAPFIGKCAFTYLSHHKWD